MSDNNRLTPEETTATVTENKHPDNPEDKLSALNTYSCLVYSELAVSIVEKQNHIKRLQNLRKEINFIKETDWMYDPVE